MCSIEFDPILTLTTEANWMSDTLMPHIADTGDLFIAFSTKSDGNMLRTNETRIAVHKNRLGFLRRSGVDPDRLFIIRTSHSPNVEVINKQGSEYLRRLYTQKPVIDTDFDHYYIGTDGALTFNNELFIGLMSGDCVPLLIWDLVSGLHGILHVGLLGALNGMVRILPQIYREHGVKLEDTRYFLGPSISQRNYNVSRSGLWLAICDQATERIENVGLFIQKEKDGEHFDVQGMICSQLLEAGVALCQIQQYAHCIADPDSIFLSHNILKQQGERGNFFSVIGKRDAITSSL